LLTAPDYLIAQAAHGRFRIRPKARSEHYQPVDAHIGKGANRIVATRSHPHARNLQLFE
jgi:hypothetical protein